ncbi:MAG: TMEM175 family protein [Parafilimonas sp.]
MREHDIFDETKRHFQLERLILFSDAVFAIAITLLVIDVKLPATNWSKLITVEVFNEYLRESIPQLMGFVFSFFIIGFYWTTHHRMFGFVNNYDAGIIWLNMFLLFFIVLIPFTTSLTSEYGYLSESFVFYYINVGCVGLVSFFLQVHIANPKKNLSIGLEDKNL